MQGCLNQDIGSFQNSLSLEEEGRSVVIMTFHPAITDTPGALYLARQFMSILDTKLDATGQGSVTEQETARSVEELLPSPDSSFHLGDLMPMMNSVVNHFIPTRKSLLDSWILPESSPPYRSRFLRGWLTEEETRDVLGQCCEDDISLHGVMLAASLLATARVCCKNVENPALKTSINMNLRQFISPTPRHGQLSAPYDETFTVPSVQGCDEFWSYAKSLTLAHNTARSSRTTEN